MDPWIHGPVALLSMDPISIHAMVITIESNLEGQYRARNLAMMDIAPSKGPPRIGGAIELLYWTYSLTRPGRVPNSVLRNPSTKSIQSGSSLIDLGPVSSSRDYFDSTLMIK